MILGWRLDDSGLMFCRFVDDHLVQRLYAFGSICCSILRASKIMFFGANVLVVGCRFGDRRMTYGHMSYNMDTLRNSGT